MKSKWQELSPVEAGKQMNQNERDWLTDWYYLYHNRFSFWHKLCSLLSYIAFKQPKFHVSNSSGIGGVYRVTCFCGVKKSVADYDTW